MANLSSQICHTATFVLVAYLQGPVDATARCSPESPCTTGRLRHLPHHGRKSISQVQRHVFLNPYVLPLNKLYSPWHMP